MRSLRKQREAREAKKLSQRAARIRAAIERESLGPHPEQATIRWEPRVYMLGMREYVRLPGMKIEVLIGGPEDLEELCLAIERGIEQWIRGGEDVSD